ncbi:putative signal transducer [Aspergillus undulatus]|uniref:putative signal transducer n=1 Tax=Aspergillus undulatus TaxID=1810928 RepID=UPI003CCD5811
MSHTDDERSSSENETPVESLIHGREKRSTAGRQMSALLDAEADDELALLFEEVDDDNEFAADAAEEGAEEDEMGLDSSSDDDDDQGPNAQANDFEGERQLEKEEKEEKKKKRAREDLRYRITSKKVKVDPTVAPKAPTAPAPRPRKKSERVSWIPTPDEGPTRSSSRRQTMHNKELTHARLKDSEEKRVRLIATMEEAAKRKAKHKPKVLTQAERLAEAERVERHNSKSLNRWEEMEKRKAEERRAKIEALQNRRLEGPVISYWSGVATWADGRLTRVGKVTVTPKLDKEDAARKKSKKAEKEGKNEAEQKTSNATVEPGTSQAAVPIALSENPAVPATEPTQEPAQGAKQEPQQEQSSAQPFQPQPTDASQNVDTTSGQGHLVSQGQDHPRPQSKTPKAPAEPQSTPNTALDAQLPAPAASTISDSDAARRVRKADRKEDGEVQVTGDQLANASDGVTTKEPAPDLDQGSATKDVEMRDAEVLPKAEDKPSDVAQGSVTEPSPAAQSPSDPTSALPDPNAPGSTLADGQVQAPVQVESQPKIHVDELNAALAAELPTPLPAVVEHTGRCLTVLENFDDKTAQSRDFSIYFNAKKPPRLTKISSSLCVITSLPSRYRDPDTSLPFANSYAYHEIRHTAAQKYAWSSMLGCYVGPSGIAARGVPARFLDPNAKESTPKASGTGDEPNPANKEGSATGPPRDSKPTTTTPASTSAPTATAPPAAVAAPAPARAPTPTPVTAGAPAPGDAMDIDK